MSEPVEGSGAEQSVGEGVAPLGEIEVGGDGGALLVALGDEVVEVLVLRCSLWFEAEVIDDEQRHAGKGLEAALVRVDGARGIEACQRETSSSCSAPSICRNTWRSGVSQQAAKHLRRGVTA